MGDTEIKKKGDTVPIFIMRDTEVKKDDPVPIVIMGDTEIKKVILYP